MSNISKTIGQRIKYYRLKKNLSQEKLAELSGCHPTYIGQLERGEKNATLTVIERVSSALNISMSKLFENIGCYDKEKSIALECYDFILSKSKKEQEWLFRILLDAEEFKNA